MSTIETTALAAPRFITYVRLHDLPIAHRNAKLHRKDVIAASIRRWGFTNPCLVDERTQRLVAGHGRREVLIDMRAAGAATPEGVLVDDDGEWLVPVVRGWSSKDDGDAEAYVLMDNRSNELGGYHGQTMGRMLEDLATSDPAALDDLAFTSTELDKYLHFADEDTFGGLEGVFPEKDDGELPPEKDNSVGGEAPLDEPEPGEVDDRQAPLFEVSCPNCAHHFTAVGTE